MFLICGISGGMIAVSNFNPATARARPTTPPSRPDVSDHVLVQRYHLCPNVSVRLRILLLQASGDRAHLSLGLRQRHARLKPCYNVKIMTGAVLLVLLRESHWHPQFVFLSMKPKVCGHDANQSDTPAIQG